MAPIEYLQFDQSRYPVVVGIDFGTTYSGCAFAFQKDETEVEPVSRWPMQQSDYPKVPTLSLYQKDKAKPKLAAWGWNAHKMAWSPTVVKERDHFMLSQFKLQLDESLDNKPLEGGITALDAIADYLEGFLAYVTPEILKTFGKAFTPQHFRFCLTVPAMWSDRAKNIMRQAAIKAKIISEDDHPDRLILVSEHEAAAAYCERKCERFKLEHKDRFMVCDAGGGTVDLIVYEVEQTTSGRRLSEVVIGQGASCGSVFLDKNAQKLIEEKFGKKAMARIPPNLMPLMIERFVVDIKPLFKGDEDLTMMLPCSGFFDTLENAEEIGISDGMMTLSAKELKDKVFEPVIKDILKLIRQQLDDAKECPTILLVGGFGTSSYLLKRIQEEFEGRVDYVGVPPRPELAVVRGAVYVGMNPSVKTRVARRCYGVGCSMPYLFEQDYEVRRRVAFDPHGPIVMGCCQWFVKRGQKIDVDECVTHEFESLKSWHHGEKCPMDDKAFQTTIYSYDGAGEPPRFTDSPGVRLLAHVRKENPFMLHEKFGSVAASRVKMNFGENELKAVCETRGKEYSARLDFLSEL
ncbi:hypothetical protein BGW38_002977 [Lunasporangiospora selenospora]|uniref:Actin-like ATPase domain-containing protein n=1 Tax=Lunasporangiospora selenospora TaxID=979761 RepID=A0A9P6FS20_9FUNG|nr:hypothetical protein BGW38_002977 [Lunasporangiospora selenospora]